MTIDRKFLRHVLPDIGEGRYVFLVTMGPKGSKPKHTACRSVETLAQHAEKKLHLDVYFTPFVFDTARRKQDHAVDCRSFFVDIDVGPDKAYASLQEAGAGLVAFLEKTGFPPPSAIVKSGSGLHCYWAMTESLANDTWHKHAEALKRMCLANQLHIDAGVTADQARILRVPGSINYKRGKDPVEVLKLSPRLVVRMVLDKLPPEELPAPADIPDYLVGTGNTDSQIGQVSNYPAALAGHMIGNCQLLSDVARTGGENCEEPLWRNILYLLAFCEEGKDFLHPLSKKHPDYSHADTEAKFQQSLRAREKGPGPTLCTTLEHAHGGTPCEGCPHRGIVKSPILLGAPRADPSQPPKRFPVERNAITYQTESGNRHLCRLFDLSVEEYVGDTTTTVLVMKFPGLPAQALEYSGFHDIGTLRKHVGANLDLTKKHMSLFDELVSSWVRELRDTSNGYLKTQAHIGWANDWSSFTFTDRILQKEGNTISTRSLHGMQHLPALKAARAMHRAGDYGEWQSHVQDVVDTGIPETHIIMAQSFAAALTALVPDPPAVTVLVSAHSGAGKTTMFRAANSVWFSKERGIAMRDTENYINNTIMTSRDVPVFWDELQIQSSFRHERDKKMEEVSSIVFRVHQGMDKGRMDSNATVKDKAMNRPLVVVSSNTPLADMLTEHHQGAPEAMAARTLQLIADGRPKGNLRTVTLDENYGVAGEAFVRALMLLGPKKTRNLIATVDAKIMATPLNPLLEGMGRMWRSNVVLTISAALLVNKLKILRLDLPTIMRVMAQAVYRTQRSTKQASTRKDAFASLFEVIHTAQAIGEVIITQDIPRRGPRGHDFTFVEIPNNRLQLWLAPAKGWGRIRKTVLENALRNHGLVAQRAIEALQAKQVVVTKRNVTYDPRQSAKAMRGPCFDINLNALNAVIKNRPV